MTDKEKAIEALNEIKNIKVDNSYFDEVLNEWNYVDEPITECIINEDLLKTIENQLNKPTLDDAIAVVEKEVDRLLHGIDRKSHIECHEATIILTAIKGLKEGK